MKIRKLALYIYKKIREGNNNISRASISLLLFFFITLISSFVDFLIIINLPKLINSIATDQFSHFLSVKFLALTILSLPLRVLALKILTKAAVKISEIPNEMNLLFISMANSNKLLSISPDKVRLQLNSNSYDLHRTIVLPVLSAIYAAIASLFMCYGAFVVDRFYSTILLFIALIIFFIIYILSKGKYRKTSKKLDIEFNEFDKQIREFSENLREIYVYDLFKLSNKNIKFLRNKLYDTYSNSVFLTRLPKNLLECLIFVVLGIFLFSSGFVENPNSIKTLFGTLVALGAAGVRVLTLSSQAFNCLIGVITYKHYFTSGIDFNRSLSIYKDKSILYNLSNYENLEDRDQQNKDFNIIKSLRLDNISSKYISNSFLKPININIKNNNIMLIKGASGSGKSSLLNIICGFINPDKGSVIVNFKESKTSIINKEFIGYATQIPILFDETIAFNISLEKSNKQNLKKLINCGIKTGCFDYKDFIELDTNNINNLESIVESFIYRSAGRDGMNLSGGQKKRISLARAFYSDRNILIMDEPTSGLDNQFEDYIVDNIIKDIDNKILIISTHSNKFDKYADEIVYL
tara:strand:- start:602 stop:2341 length:1740 start_codon:yes stop_codon:yes gene_type:complete